MKYFYSHYLTCPLKKKKKHGEVVSRVAPFYYLRAGETGGSCGLHAWDPPSSQRPDSTSPLGSLDALERHSEQRRCPSREGELRAWEL